LKDSKREKKALREIIKQHELAKSCEFLQQRVGSKSPYKLPIDESVFPTTQCIESFICDVV